MRILGAAGVIVVALASVASADRMVKTNLDVAIPVGWRTVETVGQEDRYITVGSGDGLVRLDVGRIYWRERYSILECSRRLEELAANDRKYTVHAGRPSWLPISYYDVWATVQSTDGEQAVVCTDGPDGDDGDFLFVIVASSSTSPEFATATSMLEAIAEATEFAAPEEDSYEPAMNYSTSGTYEDASAAEVPVDDPEPAPKREPARDRALRVGLGLAYLAPGQMQASGYGLAASAGFHVGAADARWRGEASAMFGVDSNAGLWADVHAHAIVRLVGDGVTGFTLSAHGGAGFDGIGKENTEMKVSVPYAVSPQLGLGVARSVDDGAYGLDGTFAVRFPNEPGGALRVGVSRQWHWRRLASVSLRYLRYAEVVGQVSLMVGIRL